jgi:hypothetical protein
LIKYIKGVLWRVAKPLSYIEDARCPKVNRAVGCFSNIFLCSFGTVRDVQDLVTST